MVLRWGSWLQWFQRSGNLLWAGCHCRMEVACLERAAPVASSGMEADPLTRFEPRIAGLLGSSCPFCSDLGCSWLPRTTACRGTGSVSRAHFKILPLISRDKQRFCHYDLRQNGVVATDGRGSQGGWLVAGVTAGR